MKRCAERLKLLKLLSMCLLWAVKLVTRRQRLSLSFTATYGWMAVLSFMPDLPRILEHPLYA